MREIDGSEEVYFHLCSSAFHWCCFNRAVQTVTGVVDENIHAPVFGDAVNAGVNALAVFAVEVQRDAAEMLKRFEQRRCSCRAVDGIAVFEQPFRQIVTDPF
ncbi:hypothetical protein SDC9_185624 [bioreactor metagenome]|uniref:Uncharacterized protein n=1 Tax=bioreactor metagenome TaxID=1076179 RepID=A0A645HH84_9ZZZZ